MRTEPPLCRVVRVYLADYRADPLGYERLAAEDCRVIVERPDGHVYATIGGRSVFDASLDV